MIFVQGFDEIGSFLLVKRVDSRVVYFTNARFSVRAPVHFEALGGAPLSPIASRTLHHDSWFIFIIRGFSANCTCNIRWFLDFCDLRPFASFLRSAENSFRKPWEKISTN